MKFLETRHARTGAGPAVDRPGPGTGPVRTLARGRKNVLMGRHYVSQSCSDQLAYI